ncbi:MAG: nitroreductase family protein [Spirochaetia bacterium]
MIASPFLQLVRSRTSLRSYDEREVADADIVSMAEAARLAPSAENGQPWRFIAVKDPAVREALAKACFSGIFTATRFASRAPLIVALCAERAGIIEAGKTIKDRAMYQLDCGIAGEHLTLRAVELGLGACWIGWFDRRRARAVLRLPFHVQVVALIAVGYPSEKALRNPRTAEGGRGRKPLSDLLWRDTWGTEFPGAGRESAGYLGEREK